LYITESEKSRRNGCLSDNVLLQQGVPDGLWGLWQNIVAQATIAAGFLTLSYIQLRRVNKYK
jgi:hypothetical protein